MGKTCEGEPLLGRGFIVGHDIPSERKRDMSDRQREGVQAKYGGC